MHTITMDSSVFIQSSSTLSLFVFFSRAHAEAPCAGIVRAARNFVADVGEAAASASTGLVDLASRSEENAERDCHRLLVNRYKLSLPIPVSRLDTHDDLRVPVLKLRDWAEYILRSNSTHILCGLDVPDWQRESDILVSFWNKYRQQCPQHPIFEKSRLGELQLKYTFPMVFHGDEGRGRRRQAFLVMNFHGVLGRGLRKKTRTRKLRTFNCFQTTTATL